MGNHVEIPHNFTMTMRIEGEDITLEDRLMLCNFIDAYEVVKDLTDILVVDVLKVDEKRVTVKISLKNALTYKEIAEYISDLVKYVGEEMKWKVKAVPETIEWEIKKFGAVSEQFDVSDILLHPKRMEILSKFDIHLGKEAKSRTKMKYNLEPGKAYIIKGKKLDKAFDVFKDLVTHGHHGLCVTRKKPNEVREKYGLKKTPIVWLTQNDDPSEQCMMPTDIPRLHVLITQFLEKAENSVILLEGIEYIITNNNFSTALKLVQLVTDKVMLYESKFILPVDTQTLSDRENALLGRYMITIE